MSAYRPDVLFDRLRAMRLPVDDYAIFGSGPLAVRGLVDELGDLDVICRGRAWESVRESGQVVRYGDDVTIDMGNGLTFGRSWAYGDFDLDSLIDGAELIDGLPFVGLDHVVEFKRIAGRPKDLEHLERLEDSDYLE